MLAKKREESRIAAAAVGGGLEPWIGGLGLPFARNPPALCAAGTMGTTGARDTHLIRLPFSSVLSREGAGLREPVDAVRMALGPGAAPAGVEGSGLTVMLDRALSVLEPVMELKREPASFLPIVTSNGGQAANEGTGGRGCGASTGAAGLCLGHFSAVGGSSVFA